MFYIAKTLIETHENCFLFSNARSVNADCFSVATAATLPNVLAQVNQDQLDLDAAIKANQVSGTGAAALKAAGGESSLSFPQETVC